MTTSRKCGILLCAAAAFLAGSCATTRSPYVAPPTLADCHGPPLGGSASMTIGSAGGTLRLTPAGHSLRVPPGAVSTPTLFTLAEGTDPAHVIVEVGPSGTTFNTPAELSLNVQRCTRQNDLKVARVQSDGSLEELPSTMGGSGSTRTVSAPLDHLSQYAVAQN